MAAISFTAVTKNIDGSWTYTWAAGLGTVRVVLWGHLLATTDDTEYTYTPPLHNSATIAPPVEVVLDGELACSEANVCFLRLQWYRVACRRYDIEYKDGASWVLVTSVADDPLIYVQTFETPLLPDQVLSEWRVTAIDDDKREGTPLAFGWYVVRPPDPPSVPDLACVLGTLTVS